MWTADIESLSQISLAIEEQSNILFDKQETLLQVLQNPASFTTHEPINYGDVGQVQSSKDDHTVRPVIGRAISLFGLSR